MARIRPFNIPGNVSYLGVENPLNIGISKVVPQNAANLAYLNARGIASEDIAVLDI